MIATNKERATVTRIVNHALTNRYFVTVFNGERSTIFQSSTKPKILEALFTTDRDVMTFWQTNAKDGIKRRVGQITLTYGDDSKEAIKDFTDNEKIGALVCYAEKLKL